MARNQADWFYPYFLFAKGLAEYRQGQFDQAISMMRGDASRVLGPGPRLVLAMSLHRSGQVAEARKTLASAIVFYDWRANQARGYDDWIVHVLRREAEGLILPNLPAFLDGKYQPQDNDERLALLGVCQFKNRTRSSACLYVDAFAAAPSLAEDLGVRHRHNAARVAALAGCGRGEDAEKLSVQERTRWRKRARQWLRADLALWTKILDSGSAMAPDLAKKMLTLWQVEPDLAGIRDPSALDKLSPDERKEWLALWQAVANLLERAQGRKNTMRRA
jgi:serine/threonine-protein kinase